MQEGSTIVMIVFDGRGRRTFCKAEIWGVDRGLEDGLYASVGGVVLLKFGTILVLLDAFDGFNYIFVSSSLLVVLILICREHVI